MVDFTKGLVPLDTSPLMQVFAFKEQQKIREEDMSRQKRIDAMNAETTALQQRKLRMELEAMSTQNPELLQDLVGSSVRIASAAEGVLGELEMGVTQNGPATTDLAQAVQSAQSRFKGTRWEGTFSRLPALVKSGDWESVVGAIDGLMAEVGVAKTYAGELTALNDLKKARSGITGDEIDNNAKYYQDANGNFNAVFGSPGNWVDANGRRVVIPENTQWLESMNLNASSSGDLPSGEFAKFVDTAVAAKNFNETAIDLVNIISQPGLQDVNTVAGSFANFTNTLRAEARAIGDMFGVKPAEGSTFDSLINPDNYQDRFREMGIVSREVQSMFTSLAYQAAAAQGQEGRSISDRDITRFLNQVGENAADPETIKRVILRTAEDVSRGVRNTKELKFPDREFNNDLSLPALRSAVSGVTQTVPQMSDDQFNQLLEVLTR